jgi:hypothetical protein
MYTESIIVHVAECLGQHLNARNDATPRGLSLWILVTLRRLGVAPATW